MGNHLYNDFLTWPVKSGKAHVVLVVPVATPLHYLSFTNCKGFSKNDGVSCYANSILQCLLQYMSVRNACVGSGYPALCNLEYNYVDPTMEDLLSSRHVC